MSKDRYIIDGHHRFLTGMLIDPKMKVNVLMIDMPISELLPSSLDYSDTIGNVRNESNWIDRNIDLSFKYLDQVKDKVSKIDNGDTDRIMKLMDEYD